MNIHCLYDKLVDPKSLKEHPKNRNQHPKDQIDRLVKILEYQGFRYAIKVSNRSGFITSGHGRRLAAIKRKLKEVPVVYQDYETDEQEYADIVADNAIASWSELDMSNINVDIGDLGPDFDIDLLGIKNFEIEVADKMGDPDEVPETPKEPKSVLSDLYELGNHRLLCGDATSIDAVEKLMNGEKADMVFTDPPYGMNAVSKSGVLSKTYKSDILGDSDTNAAKDSFNLAISKFPEADHIWFGANYYSSTLPNAECWIVWDKNNGQSDQTDCELAWTNFRSVVRKYTQSSEKSNRVHPTQKPVSLFEWVMERFDCHPATVLDLFGGSGSTLIACEKTNRKCFMMELDPHYVDVIVSRYVKFTGNNKIKLNGNDIEWSLDG